MFKQENKVKTRDGMNLFTPQVPGFEDLRAFMELDANDFAKIKRGRGWKARVFDHASGKTYDVAAASCGIPTCYCAARIVREVQS